MLKRLLILSWSIPLASYGQEMEPNKYNLVSFTENAKDVTTELKKLTPPSFYDHPEFGMLPYNAPCQNCYELIQLRTDTTRMFVEKGSEGTSFYSQASYNAMSYLDDNGYYRTIDHRLKPGMFTPGIYTAEGQATPLTVNTIEHNTSFALTDGQILKFNVIELIHESAAGIQTSHGMADWSNITIGDDGAKITEAWPGIDIEMKVRLGEVKTNYIIKSNPGFTDGFLIFKDDFTLPAGYEMEFDPAYTIEPISGKEAGTINILSNGQMAATIGVAYGFDASGQKNGSMAFGYDMAGDDVAVYVPAEWINDPAKVYPLTVDPVVTSTALYTAGIMRYRFGGSFCPGANADCQYTLNVPRPANATLTGATFSLVHQTIFGVCAGCWMSEAGFYFSTTCGLNGYWGCNVAAQGTCTATNLNISNLVTCLAPACAGNVPVTIFNSFCYCNFNGACVGNSCHGILNNTWSITITGNTVGTLGNNVTGNGSQTINDPTCAGTSILNPTAANGVPGYTYNWSTGATTPTISVVNTPAVYTCTVTDACGVSVIATFNIGCPLPVRLNYFEPELVDEKVAVKWETLSETNDDYFIVQRSDNSMVFEDLIQVDAIGSSSQSMLYSWLDESPLEGVSYYRLAMVDQDGAIQYSEIRSVLNNESGSAILIVPNPNDGSFELVYSSNFNGDGLVEVFLPGGRKVKTEDLAIQKGTQSYKLDFDGLPAGVYVLKLTSKEGVFTERLVIR